MGRAKIIQVSPFSGDRKAMGIVVHLQSSCYRLFLKGASEILTKKCTHHIVDSTRSNATPLHIAIAFSTNQVGSASKFTSNPGPLHQI
jgi:magnesium-transporting ATPase (P-type)